MKLSKASAAAKLTFSIFSMFFGAGNVIFPIFLGATSRDQGLWTHLGLVLTAVGAPILGLYTMTLFRGETKSFFYEIGKGPGLILLSLLFLLLGPFAVLPRCVTLSHAAFEHMFPQALPLWAFATLTALFTLLSLGNLKRFLDILGQFLAPSLLALLIFLIGKGLLHQSGEAPVGHFEPFQALNYGLSTGLGTLDLLAALFFGKTLWILSQRIDQKSPKKLATISCFGGATLLAIVYLGLSFVAFQNQLTLTQVAKEKILLVLSEHILGAGAHYLIGPIIILACLTTILGLTLTLWEIALDLCPQLEKQRKSFLALSVLLTTLMSLLGLETIMGFITPIASFLYPAVIVLTLAQIIKRKKARVSPAFFFYGTLILTAFMKWI